jgi:multiple sugar transport system permease protein
MINKHKSHLDNVKGRTLISDADFRNGIVKLSYRILFLMLLLGTVTTIFPLIWIFLCSLKDSREIFQFPPTFIPEKFHFINYITAWTKIRFVHYFANTFFIAFGTWFIQIFTGGLAAYALSKLKVPYGKIIFLLFLSTLMVPFWAIMIPLYLTIRDINIFGYKLLDTYWAIWLPAGVSAFNIFLLKGFFDGLPNDLMEAARVDGASEVKIFISLVLPLSKPVIAVVTIFSFMATWNDFLWPYLVLSTPEKYPIMVRLFDFSTQPDIPWNVIMAALMLASIPPILLFMFFQKYIMRGIALTGLKG